METIQAIQKRRSIRKFKQDPVPNETLLKILDCARLAPSARNVQPCEFIVVTNSKTKERISGFAAVNAPFIKEAPVCIVIISKDTKYYLEDGCAATENLLLTAADLGLGTCWVAGDKKDYCQDVLNLLSVPGGYKLVSMVALGFSAAGETKVPKNELKQLVHWDKF